MKPLNQQLSKSLQLSHWFFDQLELAGSEVDEFYENFLLAYILKNLSVSQKIRFLHLSDQAQTVKAMEYVNQCLPGLKPAFNQALLQEVNQLKQSILKL